MRSYAPEPPATHGKNRVPGVTGKCQVLRSSKRTPRNSLEYRVVLTRHAVCSTTDDGRLTVKSGMAENLESLPERVDVIERKLDALSLSVDTRFDAVDGHVAEQRRYIEFAYQRLEERMNAGFDRLDGGLLAVNSRLERLEAKLDHFIGSWSGAMPRRRVPRRPKKR